MDAAHYMAYVSDRFAIYLRFAIDPARAPRLHYIISLLCLWYKHRVLYVLNSNLMAHTQCDSKYN